MFDDRDSLGIIKSILSSIKIATNDSLKDAMAWNLSVDTCRLNINCRPRFYAFV